jgi:hypothetical protein
MVEATQKGNKMLKEFNDQINATNVLLKEEQIEIQDKLVEKQLEHFKIKDGGANHT